MDVRGKSIYIGLSGGVDSALSAALLQRAGSRVTGVFIKGWYPPGMPCTWRDDRRDAMRVAAKLRIPFHTLDASAEYKKSVIEYLLTEYRAGRTPNPDIMCNREVKFGAFYRYAMETGADAIAMGHYRSGEKDQSYFLAQVPKEILDAAIFPVGHMSKDMVRRLARRFHLPVAEKKDSQGVCFLGSISVEEFLQSELGTDNPALLYTLGQRVGGEGLPFVASAEKGPWYVVGKDVGKREIRVSKTRTNGVQEIRFTHTNWFSDVGRTTSNIEARYRYRGPRVRGCIEQDVFISDVALPEIPTPGQAVVFYSEEKMVGSGIIAG